jgi:hypothetical protein
MSYVLYVFYTVLPSTQHSLWQPASKSAAGKISSSSSGDAPIELFGIAVTLTVDIVGANY